MYPQRSRFLLRRSAAFVVPSVALMIALTDTAHAYIDPGTGSMLLQLLGAGVAGLLFYLRNWRSQLMHWLRGRKPATDKSESQAEPD